jgi:hypothetical protein
VLLELVEGAVGGLAEGTLQNNGIINFLGNTFTEGAAVGTFWDTDMDYEMNCLA